MAYIEIFPKSSAAQKQLTDNCNVLMDTLNCAAKDVLGIPEYDIIIELNQCSVISFNPTAIQAGATPDVVIKIATSDHVLQPKFEALSARVVNDWKAHFEENLALELWINLIETWACTIDFD